MNYFTELQERIREIRLLGLLVEQYLAFAETMAGYKYDYSTGTQIFIEADC